MKIALESCMFGVTMRISRPIHAAVSGPRSHRASANEATVRARNTTLGR